MLTQLQGNQEGRRSGSQRLQRSNARLAQRMPQSRASDRISRGLPKTNSERHSNAEATMLSEKFFLVLETLRSHNHPDGSQRVVSSSRHVPVKLPEKSGKS
jgi:hypothetical protein